MTVDNGALYHYRCFFSGREDEMKIRCGVRDNVLWFLRNAWKFLHNPRPFLRIRTHHSCLKCGLMVTTWRDCHPGRCTCGIWGWAEEGHWP